MPDGKVDLWVRNQGKPIAQNDLDKISQPFSRLEAGIKIKEGWGIGLTLIKGIVNEHEGTLQVTSNENKGTCSHLFFST